jgi:hypothetical protein
MYLIDNNYIVFSLTGYMQDQTQYFPSFRKSTSR